MSAIDKAFETASRILFGKEVGGVRMNERWLGRRIDSGRFGKSFLTGGKLFVPNYSILGLLPDDKLSGLESLNRLSLRQIRLDDGDGLRGVSKKAREVEAYIVEFAEGKNIDVADSVLYNNLSHVYKTIDCWNGKYQACNCFNDFNEHTFGCSQLMNCSFCIHCYNSQNLARCFETDACFNCTDSMFIHNCENVRESLFCFNTKNKKNAVFNKEVGREEYLRLRGIICEKVVDGLEKDNWFEPDIFNIGCFGKASP